MEVKVHPKTAITNWQIEAVPLQFVEESYLE